MKLSFCTLGCPDWTLQQVIENGKKIGYDGVELRGIAGNHIGPDETPESLASIRKSFDAAGLKVACIMGYSSFTIDDLANRKESIEVAIKFLKVAKAIGCPTLRVFGGVCSTQTDLAGNIARVIEGLKPVAAEAQKQGVMVALETHDDWCKGANIMSVIRGVNSPALGICWDMSNAQFTEPMDVTFAAIKGNIVHVHFKDAGKDAEGHIKSKLPGQGMVDMLGGLKMLKSVGYTGWLSFEWEKKWEPSLEIPEIAFPHYLRHASDLMVKAGVPRG